MIFHMKTMYLDGYELITANQEFQSFIRSGDIDLIISDAFINEYILNVVDSLKLPLVLHGSGPGLPYTLKLTGASNDYASIPTAITDFDDQMTFMQRMINAIQSELTEFAVLQSNQKVNNNVLPRLCLLQATPLSRIKGHNLCCVISQQRPNPSKAV